MRYDRQWLEEQGSEDSHGRALWALGECARNDSDASRRQWAAALFTTALPVGGGFSRRELGPSRFLVLMPIALRLSDDLRQAACVSCLAEKFWLLQRGRD